MRSTLLCCTVALAACGAPGPGGGAASPAPRPARVAYAPAAVDYAAVSHRRVEQEIGGRAIVNRGVTRYVLRTDVTPADGRLGVTLVLDSLEIDGELGFPASEVAQAIGARFTATLAPTGELLGFTGPETPVPLLNQIASNFRDFYPRIPAGGVAPSDRWTDTTTAETDVGGIVVLVRSVNTHETLGWREYAGQSALAIATRAQYTLAGEGAQAGQAMSLEGTGRRHLTEFLSPGGVYLGATGADTSEIEVLLTQMGMVIPVHQRSADTVVARR